MPTSYWTNPSVLALAGDSDPVEVITDRARTMALDAMEEGWTGPPFDPFALAKRQEIEVVAREELRDARMVPVEGEQVRIEFNPSRPRGRLRFSLAHELAHTLFPDASEAVRYRSGPAERKDDWQIEMLCNVAAAELLMPVGTFSALSSVSLELPDLMRLREQYDVSTEALLRRVTTLSNEPVTFFIASRRSMDSAPGRFQIDYTVPSSHDAPRPEPHQVLPEDTLLRHCTAVGHAHFGREAWDPDLLEMNVQAVGVPPFSRRPRKQDRETARDREDVLPPRARVAGLIQYPDGEAVEKQRIQHVLGDATRPRTDGTWIIGHLVNDKTSNWGGAFAKALTSRYPSAQDDFREWVAADPRRLKLGAVHLTDLGGGNQAASIVAQRDYGPRGRLRYAAFRAGLEQLASVAKERHSSVHLPRIGAGRAGGSWDLIEELIDGTLIKEGIEVTVYTLPGEYFEPPTQTSLDLAG